MVLVVALAAACSGSDDGPEAGSTSSAPVERDPGRASSVADVLEPLGRLQVMRRGGRAVVADEQGREVLLRGANLNVLADYHQADPELPPVRPATDADWDGMAEAGFSVVRLLVSWSLLEPVRGQVDEGYLARIHEAVDAAAARGIHTVIDVHQDAWGKAIATPPGTACPPGTEPAIGWDGAPAWATLTDGADTCRPVGNREGAPAVRAAFTAFYENRDGIRDAFVATWRRLAADFADEAAVAGFDLLNEPNVVLDAAASEARYTELVASLVSEIRAAELEAGGFPHIVFLEPMVLYPLPGTMPAEGFTTDGQIVFSPHSYAEVIGPKILTVEQTMDAAAATAADRGWPLWIGEHGVFATDAAALDVLHRFAAAQDAALAGGAHWQWRQRCGDPHTIGVPGTRPSGTVVQLNLVDCPSDLDAGPNPPLLEVAGRAYPRAAPGRLTHLASDPEARTLDLAGAIDDDLAGWGDLVLWVPGDEEPTVGGEGLGQVGAVAVPGGWIVTVEVTGSPYEVAVS